MVEALFHSSVSFPHEPAWHALAVYCSDGRFAPACGQFLDQHFAGRCNDRLVIPGGPGALVHNDDRDAQLEGMRFLVEAHGLSRVLLIMHEQCGYYAHKLAVEGEAMRDRQHADAEVAASLVRERLPAVEVDTLRAVIDGNRVAIQRFG